jgi:hypothetical protein
MILSGMIKMNFVASLFSKKLQADNFPRGKQKEYCREMSEITKLDPSNISAKIGNYKSVAGINNHSNASDNTVKFYKKYGELSVHELESNLQNFKI